VRATSQLRERVSGMRDALAVLASGTGGAGGPPHARGRPGGRRRRASGARGDLTPVQTADLEDA
jgi:hypothetical protein